MIYTDNRDYLTDLLNRKGLFEVFSTLDKNIEIQVLFFDLDNFKTVNDIYGHKEGDDTLINFADLILKLIPGNAIISRLGGDEFVALIPEVMSRERLESIAGSIINRCRELKEIYRAFDIISTSIGIMHNYSVEGGLETALNYADKALYYAKAEGKNTFVFYKDYADRINYESQIQRYATAALKEGKFKIMYHPVVHLHSSKLIRSEACCVWQQEDGTYWGRGVFRNLLENNGYVKDVDMYIFENACRDLVKFKAAGRVQDVISVQISPLLVLDDDFIDRIDSLMESYGVDATDFELNLDEKVFGGRIAIDKLISKMRLLKERGFSLAISGFGSDFSSVRYLKELPISAVKLDGEFITENIKDSIGKRVLDSIVSLGNGFKLTVIACHVDDVYSMLEFAKCGCDAATGDYYSKKLSFDDYLEFINTQLDDEESTVSYHFKNNLFDDNEKNAGIYVGEGLEYREGVTDEWGAVYFPGGRAQTNYVKLPSYLFEYDSYTVSMWIKPYELQNWVSAIYVRYQDGFASFMPNVAGGRCIYRINQDKALDVWHDALTRGLDVKRWTYVSASYDHYTEIVRLYINGELAVTITDVPNMTGPKEVWLGGDIFQISFCGCISGLQIDKGALSAEAIGERFQAFIEGGTVLDNGDGESEDYEYEISTHDPAIFEDPESHQFYIYATGAEGLTSSDLIHWKSLGKIVDRPLDEAIEWTGSKDIWAPDIVKVGDEYRLYCSNSSWGVQQSCIFLAVADSPKGPFIPKAAVLKTDDKNIVNGIDANIIEDHATGEQYLLYGSFWGGIHMIELDKSTGLAKEGQGIGKQVACRPRWNDGAIEGPYMIYHKDTGYYYLFVSYGSLKEDYNIRVGRSKNITGPFLDYHGRDLVAPDDTDCSVGLMIAAGYRWLSGQAYMGPGHNSVLLRENGEMFLVNHIRKLSFNDDPGPGLLQIRKLIMTPDGWPIALGQPYNAETLLSVREDLLYGDYERIELRPSIPQGIMHAHPMRILKGGRLEMGSVIGSWKITGTFEMLLEYGDIKEFVHFEKGLDREKNKTTAVMCGLNSLGICSWAKKEELIY